MVNRKERSERLELKFNLIVREVEKRLAYKLDNGHSRINPQDSNTVDFSKISPLRMLHPSYIDNPYLRALITKVSTHLPQGIEQWTMNCESSTVFQNPQKHQDLAALFLHLHAYKRDSFKAFIFWCFVAAVVCEEAFDEKVAMTIDFARVFGISEIEIVDISQVAKAFYGEHDRNYKFRSPDVEELFSTVWSYLTA